jgi:LPXTG-motif cell wall-anchored protein
MVDPITGGGTVVSLTAGPGGDFKRSFFDPDYGTIHFVAYVNAVTDLVPAEVVCTEPLPELTAACALDPTDPSQVVISWEGTYWPPGEQVDILVRGADEPAGAEEPLGTGGVDGSFAGSSVYRGGKDELVLEGRSYRATVESTVQCPVIEPPGGGETTSPPGGGGDGGSDGGSGGGVIPSVGGVFSGLLAGRLPDTGGGWAILLIAGAILIAVGWLLVRLARRFAA